MTIHHIDIGFWELVSLFIRGGLAAAVAAIVVGIIVGTVCGVGFFLLTVAMLAVT